MEGVLIIFSQIVNFFRLREKFAYPLSNYNSIDSVPQTFNWDNVTPKLLNYQKVVNDPPRPAKRQK
jgi:hypothetical protein